MPENVAGIPIPDSQLAREATDRLREHGTPLLFAHSLRVFVFGALRGRQRGLKVRIAGGDESDQAGAALVAKRGETGVDAGRHDLGLARAAPRGKRSDRMGLSGCGMEDIGPHTVEAFSRSRSSTIQIAT